MNTLSRNLALLTAFFLMFSYVGVSFSEPNLTNHSSNKITKETKKLDNDNTQKTDYYRLIPQQNLGYIQSKTNKQLSATAWGFNHTIVQPNDKVESQGDVLELSKKIQKLQVDIYDVQIKNKQEKLINEDLEKKLAYRSDYLIEILLAQDKRNTEILKSILSIDVKIFDKTKDQYILDSVKNTDLFDFYYFKQRIIKSNKVIIGSLSRLKTNWSKLNQKNQSLQKVQIELNALVKKLDLKQNLSTQKLADFQKSLKIASDDFTAQNKFLIQNINQLSNALTQEQAKNTDLSGEYQTLEQAKQDDKKQQEIFITQLNSEQNKLTQELANLQKSSNISVSNLSTDKEILLQRIAQLTQTLSQEKTKNTDISNQYKTLEQTKKDDKKQQKTFITQLNLKQDKLTQKLVSLQKSFNISASDFSNQNKLLTQEIVQLTQALSQEQTKNTDLSVEYQTLEQAKQDDKKQQETLIAQLNSKQNKLTQKLASLQKFSNISASDFSNQKQLLTQKIDQLSQLLNQEQTKNTNLSVEYQTLEQVKQDDKKQQQTLINTLHLEQKTLTKKLNNLQKSSDIASSNLSADKETLLQRIAQLTQTLSQEKTKNTNLSAQYQTLEQTKQDDKKQQKTLVNQLNAKQNKLTQELASLQKSSNISISDFTAQNKFLIQNIDQLSSALTQEQTKNTDLSGEYQTLEQTKQDDKKQQEILVNQLNLEQNKLTQELESLQKSSNISASDFSNQKQLLTQEIDQLSQLLKQEQTKNTNIFVEYQTLKQAKQDDKKQQKILVNQLNLEQNKLTQELVSLQKSFNISASDFSNQNKLLTQEISQLTQALSQEQTKNVDLSVEYQTLEQAKRDDEKQQETLIIQLNSKQNKLTQELISLQKFSNTSASDFSNQKQLLTQEISQLSQLLKQEQTKNTNLSIDYKTLEQAKQDDKKQQEILVNQLNLEQNKLTQELESLQKSSNTSASDFSNQKQLLTQEIEQLSQLLNQEQTKNTNLSVEYQTLEQAKRDDEKQQETLIAQLNLKQNKLTQELVSLQKSSNVSASDFSNQNKLLTQEIVQLTQALSQEQTKNADLSGEYQTLEQAKRDDEIQQETLITQLNSKQDTLTQKLVSLQKSSNIRINDFSNQKQFLTQEISQLSQLLKQEQTKNTNLSAQYQTLEQAKQNDKKQQQTLINTLHLEQKTLTKKLNNLQRSSDIASSNLSADKEILLQRIAQLTQTLSQEKTKNTNLSVEYQTLEQTKQDDKKQQKTLVSQLNSQQDVLSKELASLQKSSNISADYFSNQKKFLTQKNVQLNQVLTQEKTKNTNLSAKYQTLKQAKQDGEKQQKIFIAQLNLEQKTLIEELNNRQKFSNVSASDLIKQNKLLTQNIEQLRQLLNQEKTKNTDLSSKYQTLEQARQDGQKQQETFIAQLNSKQNKLSQESASLQQSSNVLLQRIAKLNQALSQEKTKNIDFSAKYQTLEQARQDDKKQQETFIAQLNLEQKTLIKELNDQQTSSNISTSDIIKQNKLLTQNIDQLNQSLSQEKTKNTNLSGEYQTLEQVKQDDAKQQETFIAQLNSKQNKLSQELASLQQSSNALLQRIAQLNQSLSQEKTKNTNLSGEYQTLEQVKQDDAKQQETFIAQLNSKQNKLSQELASLQQSSNALLQRIAQLTQALSQEKTKNTNLSVEYQTLEQAKLDDAKQQKTFIAQLNSKQNKLSQELVSLQKSSNIGVSDFSNQKQLLTQEISQLNQLLNQEQTKNTNLSNTYQTLKQTKDTNQKQQQTLIAQLNSQQDVLSKELASLQKSSNISASYFSNQNELLTQEIVQLRQLLTQEKVKNKASPNQTDNNQAIQKFIQEKNTLLEDNKNLIKRLQAARSAIKENQNTQKELAKLQIKYKTTKTELNLLDTDRVQLINQKVKLAGELTQAKSQLNYLSNKLVSDRLTLSSEYTDQIYTLKNTITTLKRQLVDF